MHEIGKTASGDTRIGGNMNQGLTTKASNAIEGASAGMNKDATENLAKAVQTHVISGELPEGLRPFAELKTELSNPGNQGFGADPRTIANVRGLPQSSRSQ
jgi:hypothetical protein